MDEDAHFFDSGFVLGDALPKFSQDHVKNEPMLFNCDRDAANTLGGPITRTFLNFADKQIGDKPIVIDTRVHMLMPGWWPCIPGWHHDDVPRERSDGQPEYWNPSYRSKHVMALAGADICRTRFACGPCAMPEIPVGEIIYKHWHERVEYELAEGGMRASECPMNRLVWFDDRAFHAGQQSRGSGWRWFGRISYDTARTSAVTNEVRRQVQVYLERPMEGW